MPYNEIDEDTLEAALLATRYGYRWEYCERRLYRTDSLGNTEDCSSWYPGDPVPALISMAAPMTPLDALRAGFDVRLSTVIEYPPEGESWHNPDSVPFYALRRGHRFLLKSEVGTEAVKGCCSAWEPAYKAWSDANATVNGSEFHGSSPLITYMTTLPLPNRKENKECAIVPDLEEI